jgi:uncharacterized membrane protein
MSAERARMARRAALFAWIALIASVAGWPAGGIRAALAAVAGLPLLLPLPGLLRGTPRTLRWAPLTQAPALALGLTELLANPAARAVATLTLACSVAAFAALIAALRAGRGP